MKTFNLKLQTALLVIGLALSATSEATPPPRGDAVWNGYYFGAYYGAGAGNARTDINFQEQAFTRFPDFDSSFQTLFLFNTNASGTLTGKATGSFADLFFGYNFYEPGWSLVFGGQLEGTIFSDITWKSKGIVNSLNSGSIVFINSDGTFPVVGEELETFNDETLDRLRSKFALVGRAGYLINPCTLIYGLGGPVAGHFVVPTLELGEDSTNEAHKNQWELGYTIGAGLELKINDHWSLRGEYRYLSFNVDRTVNLRSELTGISLSEELAFVFGEFTFTRKAKTKFNDHIGEIGVVYSF